MSCDVCFYLGGTTYYPTVKKRLCDDCADCIIDDGDTDDNNEWRAE